MEETVYKRSSRGKALNRKEEGQLKLSTNTSSIRINKTILIGRDKSCRLQIDDPLVSRRHATIEFISKVAYIKDLGSTNATYVNNNPLKPNEQKRLRRGDIIRIGKTQITIS